MAPHPSSSSSSSSTAAARTVRPPLRPAALSAAAALVVLLLARSCEAAAGTTHRPFAFSVVPPSSSSRRATSRRPSQGGRASERGARGGRRRLVGPPVAAVNGDAGAGADADSGREAEEEEPVDLFEYFDPLLSPHAYPNGISPEAAKPAGGRADAGAPPPPPPPSSPPPPEGASPPSFPGSFPGAPEAAEEAPAVGGNRGGGGGEEGRDLLDYFDPLLSPHAYPRGIDFAAGKSGTSNDREDDDDDDWSPLRMPSAGKDEFFGRGDGRGARNARAGEGVGVGKKLYKRPHGLDDDDDDLSARNGDDEEDGPKAEDDGKDKPDLFDVFDPRISPHAYADGIPDAVTYTEGTSVSYRAFRSPAPSLGAGPARRGEEVASAAVVGVLLIDHGSRRGVSNARLRTLARSYDARTPSTTVVRAAHMDVARPSIEDGLRELLERGATRIVCHPYFLSPGKHATRDVPRLIDEAVMKLGIGVGGGDGGVTVVTTDPVGSSVDAMLGAIDTIVQGALEEMERDLGGGAPPDSSGDAEKGRELGGFFGDIKRMTDEQL